MALQLGLSKLKVGHNKHRLLKSLEILCYLKMSSTTRLVDLLDYLTRK